MITMRDDELDPDRDTTPGRGQGHGEWLEIRLQQALEEWGYGTARRKSIIVMTADVIARRKGSNDNPADFIIAECKDWQDRPIDESVIIRLCLLAFMGRAMPVLCHTSRLTDRAWKLAQAYDVRLLTLEDLERDQLPALTKRRPPRNVDVHRSSTRPEALRTTPPTILQRLQDESPDVDVEAPVYDRTVTAPCYVPDRTDHGQYEDTGFEWYRRCDRLKRHTQPGDE
jgi:hypothetical protein